MENEKPKIKRDIRTPKGWIIQPPLWVNTEVRSFEENGMTFVVEGKAIKAAIKGTNLEEQEFLREASEIVERFVNAYMIVKGVFFEVPGLTSKYLVSQPSYPALEVPGKTGDQNKTIFRNYEDTLNFDAYTWLEKMGDSEKHFEFSLLILNKIKNDDTLRNCLKYFRSALACSDTLLIAGNLYMAMEELWNHPDFGDQKKLVEKLNLKPPKGITNLEDWWKEIHRARHAYHNGQRSNQMQTEELNVFKEFTRYSILAYVVWLKNNQ